MTSPTLAQHFLVHRQLAAATAAQWGQALAASVVFSAPDAVPLDAEFDGKSWASHLAQMWARPWNKPSEEADTALHAAWAPWLPEADRARLRPCEWPVAATLRLGAPIDPELLRWAVHGASDGMWEYLLECTPSAVVREWSALGVPDVFQSVPWRPLARHLAAAGRLEVLKRLVAHGFDLNHPTSVGGNTPLHDTRNATEAEVLMAAGADPMRRNRAGKTVIQHWDSVLGTKKDQHVTLARMVANVVAHHQGADARYGPLFRAIATSATDAPWERLAELGWEEALLENPPLTWPNKLGKPRSLLVRVAQTLSSTEAPSRREDLLARMLDPRVPLWVGAHESTPGLPDILWVALEATKTDVRKDVLKRLRAVQARLYPTSQVWAQAFTAAMAAIRVEGLKLGRPFLALVAPATERRIAAHPFPDWATTAEPSLLATLAPWVMESWLKSADLPSALEERFRKLWTDAEASGGARQAAWAPAVLGDALLAALHDIDAEVPLQRVLRWQASGVDFQEALASARSLLASSFFEGNFNVSAAEGLLTQLEAHANARHLGEVLPVSTGTSRPRRV